MNHGCHRVPFRGEFSPGQAQAQAARLKRSTALQEASITRHINHCLFGYDYGLPYWEDLTLEVQNTRHPCHRQTLAACICRSDAVCVLSSTCIRILLICRPAPSRYYGRYSHVRTENVVPEAVVR